MNNEDLTLIFLLIFLRKKDIDYFSQKD